MRTRRRLLLLLLMLQVDKGSLAASARLTIDCQQRGAVGPLQPTNDSSCVFIVAAGAATNQPTDNWIKRSSKFTTVSLASFRRQMHVC